MDYALQKQPRGVFALRNRLLGETMHPGRGPWEEANALYVQGSGLERLLPSHNGQGALVLFDVGLGGAANALAALSCQARLRERGMALRTLRMISFEHDPAPLRFALAHAPQLGYPLGYEAPLASLADTGRWEGEGVQWELRAGDFIRMIIEEPRRADVVFFDPFSPRTNPAMWRLSTLEGIHRCRKPGASMRLLTYSSAHSTRSALLLAGFYVGTAVGGGTEASTTFADLERPLDERWLQRWLHRGETARDAWPCQTPPGREQRLRAALLAHPQWEYFALAESHARHPGTSRSRASQTAKKRGRQRSSRSSAGTGPRKTLQTP